MSYAYGMEEGRNGLEAGVKDGSYVVRIGETKDGFRSGEGDSFSHMNCKWIDSTGVIRVDDDIS